VKKNVACSGHKELAVSFAAPALAPRESLLVGLEKDYSITTIKLRYYRNRHQHFTVGQNV